MPTDPDISHLTSRDFQHVYEPSEDSFLFMDGLAADEKFLQSRFPSSHFCLEIGSGSGIVSAYLSTILPNTFIWTTDINPFAVTATQKTFIRNKVRGEPILADLASSIDRLAGKIDILLFNPPYVPSPPEEMEGDGISRAWAGGQRGREVLDRLLPHVQDILTGRGVFYLVTVPENDPEEITTLLTAQGFVDHKVSCAWLPL